MRTVRFFLIIIIAGLIGYFIGTNKISSQWKGYQPRITVTGKEPPPSETHLDMTMFWTVMNKLESTYYDKTAIDPQKMLDGAINGMVASLDDPYTMYLPPKQNGDFKQVMAGKFEGIGAELGMKDKQIIVVAPLDGGPAQKAGIKGGDAVVKVGDLSTFGWTLNQAVDKIRGPKGSSVKLTIARKDAEKLQDVTITRDTINVKSVVAWTRKVKDVENVDTKNALSGQEEKKVAYIRLSQFGDNTNHEWVSITNNLSFQITSDPSIKGIILDLRNNPGGYLTDAVFIASEFIPDGVVVQQDDGHQEPLKMNVSRKGLLYDVPLIVLINKGSASASEIVAGALRDHNKAKLVGELSFGKGTIQQAEDLGGGAGIHVTIAKWLTPNGTWVHKKGLTPDIAVALDEKDPSHDTQLERAILELVK
ncbi:hypothetical protein BH11PAT1_BH11PAT1_2820 [soil metagenome]